MNNVSFMFCAYNKITAEKTYWVETCPVSDVYDVLEQRQHARADYVSIRFFVAREGSEGVDPEVQERARAFFDAKNEARKLKLEADNG